MRVRSALLPFLLAFASAAPATAQLWSDPDPHPAVYAAIRAEIAAGRAATSEASPDDGWPDIAARTDACGAGDLAACALTDPVLAAEQFCLDWTPTARPGDCGRFAKALSVETPLRLGRAIAAATGRLPPAPDDSLQDQIAADARALTEAAALQRPLAFVGPAIPAPDMAIPRVAIPGSRTLADILPDGIPPDSEGADSAMMAIALHPDLDAAARESLLSEFHAALSPEQAARLAEDRVRHADLSALVAPPAGSGMIGDPMACRGSTLPARLPTMDWTAFDLPADLHGSDPLAAWIVTGTGVQIAPIERAGTGSAAIFLPMTDGPEGGGLGGLVLMFADGVDAIVRRCAIMMIDFAPPDAPPGAFGRHLAGLADMVQATNALAAILKTDPAFSDGVRSQMAERLMALDAGYEAASPRGRRALDAVAAALVRMGEDPAATARGTREATVAIRLRAGIDDGSLQLPTSPFAPFAARVIPAQASSVPVRLPEYYLRQCPKDAAELDAWIRLTREAAFGTKGLGKGLLSASSVAASVSMQLAVSLWAGPAAGKAAGSSTGLGYAAYSIHLGFVEGMLPSALPAIEADIENALIHEDEPDLRLRVGSVRIISTSKGWDGRKAMLDAAIALGGALGGTGISKDAATGAAGRAAPLLSKQLSEQARVRGQQVLDAISRHPAFATAASGLMEGARDALLSEVDGIIVKGIYDWTNRPDAAGFVAPRRCVTDLPIPDWAIVTIEGNTTWQSEAPGIWRPLAPGRGTLTIRPRPDGDRWSGLSLPVLERRVEVPELSAERVSSPGSIEPGAAADIVAALINSGSDETVLDWKFDAPGIVASEVGPRGLTAQVTGSHRAADYPLLATARPTGRFLPESTAASRPMTVLIQTGRLWLIATRDCIGQGGKVQVHAFDAATNALVDPGELILSTDVPGIDVDATGLVSSTRDEDFVTISARGTGTNSWRGQIRIRARCTCGAEMFDPRLVTETGQNILVPASGRLGPDGGTVQTVTGASGPILTNVFPNLEIFGLRGEFEVVIGGDVSLTHRRPLTLHMITVRNDGPTGPACSLLTAGDSGLFLGGYTKFARPGTLVAAASDAMGPGTYDDNIAFDLETFGGPKDASMAYPTAPPHVRVVDMRDDNLVIEITGAFLAEGYEEIAGRNRSRFVRRNVQLAARFATRLPDDP